MGRIGAWIYERIGGRLAKLAAAIVTIIVAAVFTSINAEDVRAYHGAVAEGLMENPHAGMLYRVTPGAAGSNVGGKLCVGDHRPDTITELKESSAPAKKTYVNWIGKTVPVGDALATGFGTLGIKVVLSHEFQLEYFLETRLGEAELSVACQIEVEAALHRGDLVCTVDRVIRDAKDEGRDVFGVIFDKRAIAPLNAVEIACPQFTHQTPLYAWRSALVVEE